MTSRFVDSPDGTRIAYGVTGAGAPLIQVDGAFGSRVFGPSEKLGQLLEGSFRVIRYDRRGRNESGDTAPYDVQREVEDLLAIAGAIGEPLHVYGTSSGAVLAARAVAAGLPTRTLVLHEPPLSLDGTHYPSPADYQDRIAAMLADGRRTDAGKLFLRVVGVPAVGVFFMRLIPGVFRSMSASAHTLPYDFAVLGDTQRGGPLPTELADVLRGIHAPTRVLIGGKSPEYLHHAARTVAEHIEGASLEDLPGQMHNVSPKAVAPVLERFCVDAPDRAAAS